MIKPKPPITGDVAELIGEYAEKVSNRSLLLDKFPIHKQWPQDPNGPNSKWDDASRWSFIRVADDGEVFLRRELNTQTRMANGQNVQSANSERARNSAEVIERLMRCDCRRPAALLSKMRIEHRERFAEMFLRDGERSAAIIGKLRSRMAINLSDSLIQNAGICLDRLFGEPYVPGSAVKGVARHMGLERLRAGELELETFRRIFGSADCDFGKGGELAEFADEVAEEDRDMKGAVDFLAAYPIGEVKVVVDITNVHYPDFYRSGRTADLKNEKPQPNPFPATEKGAEFAFCIRLNGMSEDTGLVKTAEGILRDALEKRGIGAKAGAGYGWFDCSATARWRTEIEKKKEESEKSAALEALSARVGALSGMDENAREFRAELAAIAGHQLYGSLDQQTREELAKQRKRLPKASAIDAMREQWNRQPVNAVIGNFIREFGKLPDERKTAVVKLLQETEGRGKEVWSALKAMTSNEKKKQKVDGIEGAIRGWNNKHKLGKMP